ncbi:polysaccharide biosynthesis tyrosine autokinase [Nodosilinea sp. FACHB-131]|uniref:GumC family protein n=1 Tax=Cyanophyceae TaxID=3028117 RepID=UPI0016876BE2|nr:polysaccharide biosynthesis tyrosine autokinase [Nodosilinea sp. FACHB-131]MBD1876702.1 polysaccharide biosynthesis tyrosine autokinase [Nodosilinea sp. FACHB-131]
MNTSQYWLMLKRRWLPATVVFASAVASTAVTLSLQPEIYQAEGKIRFTGADKAAALTGVGAGVSGFDPTVESNNPITTEMEEIRSTPILDAVVEKVNAFAPADQPSLSRGDLKHNLSLTSPRGTDILLLTYRDRNPKLAQAVVDAVMLVYIDQHIQDNRAETVAAREFLERELPGAEARVQAAETELRRFQEAHQVASLEEEKGAMVVAREELNRHLAEVNSELADVSGQAQSFSEQLGMTPQQAIALTSLNQSPGVQDILTQFQAVEAQLAVERVRYRDASPVVSTLLTRRAHLEALLDERIAEALHGLPAPAKGQLQGGELKAALAGDLARTEAKRQGLTQQVNALAAAQSAYTQRAAQLPFLEQEQRELMRRLEAAQSTYALLLGRLHEARVTENQNMGNARIMQPAVALDQPVAPRGGSFLATGALLGLGLAGLTALGLESRDRKLKTATEAKDLFGLTLLGMIPDHRWGHPLPSGDHAEVVVEQAPSGAIAEAYRMLQANLRFLSSDRDINTVVITSSVIGEGKSVVSANLAMARAQTGQRVLLIDADMRCPRQHKIWHVVNDQGLSNLLVEQRPAQGMIKTPVEHLDLLTAGVIPPNPAVLIDSQRMVVVLEQLAQTYDFIVIDTPALNIGIDALALGQMADGVVLVTRPGVVDIDSATMANERLTQSRLPVLGQVINGILPRHEPHSYFYYGTYGDRNGGTARQVVDSQQRLA